jgi:hypothetical protein
VIALILLTLVVFIRAAPLPDEDAYITYVFSKNLLAGNGLTYNGVPVEGYTNPLTLLATALVAGWSPLTIPAAGQLLSVVFSCLTIAVFFLILFRSLRARFGLFTAAALTWTASCTLILSRYFTYWGFSGMENSLLTFVVLASVYAYLEGRWRLSLFFASLLPVVRFDGIVPALVIVGFHCMARVFGEGRPVSLSTFRRHLPSAAASLVLTLVPFLLVMLFRVFYYGDVVPNTAYQKFALRDPDQRLLEGLVYCWNNFWSSKSILYIAPAVALIALRRYTWDSGRRLIGLLILAGTIHLAYIGGDVAWKDFFRFGHLINCLVLLFAFLSLVEAPLPVQGFNVAVVWALTLFLQPSPVVPTLPYARELVTTYTVRYRGPRVHDAGDFRSWYHGLTTDFPEDVFAATGKYLRTIAGGSDRLVTSAAGKIVYYSGLRTYDTTGLADRVWSRNSNEQNLALLRDVRFIAFHAADSACYFGPFIAPHTAYVPIAVIGANGSYTWVFSDRDPVGRPASIGERVAYVRRPVQIDGRFVDWYPPSGSTQDASAIAREYSRWITCVVAR